MVIKGLASAGSCGIEYKMDIQNQIQNRSDFADFIEWTASQIDELVVGKQQARDVFVKHIDKVMAEAEKYRKYLQAEYHKAKKAKRTLHADQPKSDGWYWYTAWSKGTTYYFDGEGTERWATFWMRGKPKLDPLDYLKSMVLGCVGQMCKTLEIIDYQFTLLSIIHDAQRWAAGQERIYFNPNSDRTLADSFCNDLCPRLFDEKRTYIPTLRDVQVTIKTALEKVKSCMPAEIEQNSTPVKSEGESWLWKLYEKTLKVIVDAVLGKVWHP